MCVHKKIIKKSLFAQCLHLYFVRNLYRFGAICYRDYFFIVIYYTLVIFKIYLK